MLSRTAVLALFLAWMISLGAAPAAAQKGGGPGRPMPIVAETYNIGKAAYVRALAIDQGRNSLWVGTSLGAMEIDLANGAMKKTFTRKDGLANEYVFAITVAPKGAIWMGTNAGGVSIYHKAKWKTYFPMHGLADYWVYAFAFGKDGDLWIGTWDGVSRFDHRSETFTNYRQELINVWVYGIDVDARGRVWMGTEGGVSMYDNGKWSSWTQKDGVGARNFKDLRRSPNTGLGTRLRHDLAVRLETSQETYNPDYVFAVKVDNHRQGVWFGTWGGGVSFFSFDGSWRSYTNRDGLAGNIVYSIAQEPDGTLWFGTNRGASRFDGKKWTTFNRSKGLINDHIYAVAIDRRKMIWLGSKGGVTRLTYGSEKELLK